MYLLCIVFLLYRLKQPQVFVWRSHNNFRYNMMREALYQGNTVQIKSGGKSLEPLVYSGDTCCFDPVIPGHNILAGDIVFVT